VDARYEVCDGCGRWALVKPIQEKVPMTVNRYEPVQQEWCAECRRKQMGHFRYWH
jgi:hypothetical protein